MTRINHAAYFGMHLIAALLMSEKCATFLQSDSNRHRKVIIHVPLHIKHLTRTIVKVIEKPVVKEYKHDGEIIHHHRHSGHIEHDHSHDIHGPLAPSHPLHEHRMDDKDFPTPDETNGNSETRRRQNAAYVDPAVEPVVGRKFRPAIRAQRLSKHVTNFQTLPLSTSPPASRRKLPSVKQNFYSKRPQIGRDSYIRVLFRSTEV